MTLIARSTYSIATASLLSLFCGSAVHAEERSSLGLTWENDTFLNSFFNGRYTDRHYTQGLWVNFMHRDDTDTDDFFYSSTLMKSIWDFGMDIEKTRGGFSFGQTFYTPEDIGFGPNGSGVGISRDAFRLQRDDRPYAGYVFIEPKWERRGRSGLFNLQAVPTRDRFGIALGVVGPSAGAEYIQTKWHGLFEYGVEPVGWRHQLNDEFAFTFHGERSWLFTTESNSGKPYLDFMPTLGLDLGNVSTRLTAGAEVRLGIGNIHDFSIPSMEGTDSNYGFFLFGSVEGWAVARNIFLDGNTFSDSHSVDKKNLVGEVSLGIGLKTECFDGRLAWVRRSLEFDLQDVPNSYLSADLTFKF